MKRVLTATTAIAALAALAMPAVAADLPARVPVFKSPMAAPPANWTGFYIGLNAGYGWGSDDRADVGFAGSWTPSGAGQGQAIKPAGGLFGGQVGYNWQVHANWVLGVELMGDWASLRQTDASAFYPTTGSWHSKVNGLMTATGRIGYAFGHWMPYVKGGYAGANLRSSMFDSFGDTLGNSAWRNGWAIGAGFEYAVTANWILGLEYDHLDFGSSTWNGTTVGANTPESIRDKLTVDAVLGRVSYKFGGGGPIATRY